MTALLMNVREKLNELRSALYRLHKALLDSERLAYEAEFGRIPSSGEYLQLLVNDQRFTWLQPYTSLVVRLDETLESKKPEALDAAAGHWRQIQSLTMENGELDRERYAAAVERHAPAREAHAAVMAIIEENL